MRCRWIRNRVQVPEARVETFVDRLRTSHGIEEQPGFRGLKLLSPVDAEGYVTMTFWDSREQYEVWRDGTAFERAHDDSDADENVSILAAKTAVHEIGHHLRIGEADDQCCWTENYSGSNDDTPEEVRASSVPGDPERWSVMSSGHPADIFVAPSGTRYTAFSLEELFTVTDETPNR